MEPDYRSVFTGYPRLALLIDPELTVLAVNDIYVRTTGRAREDVVGTRYPETFAAGAPTEFADKVAAAVREATATGESLRLQRGVAAVPGPGGELAEHHWVVEITPVAPGLLLVQADDVTHRVLAARRLQALAEVAVLLAGARDLPHLADIVVGAGLAAIGADGGALGVIDGAELKLTLTDSLGPENRVDYPTLNLTESMTSIAHTARTGEPVFLPTLEETYAYSISMQTVHQMTGKPAWASLPLWADGRLLGAIAVSWGRDHPLADEEIDLLRAFAAQTGQALDRLQRRAAEVEADAASRRLSETLQRSLLTEPPQPDTLEIAVRYQPAAREAQIGGDWYDAFLSPSGDTTLVIGDVSGHDRMAAAAMGQIRNLLRGVAQMVDGPPSAIITGLDEAMERLGVGVLATAVVAQIHQTPAQRLRGARTLRWSSAGHPPPLIIEPDGRVRIALGDPDLLLGVGGLGEREDFIAEVETGSTVLLFTDGLVERRGEELDTGIERLRAAAEGYAGLPVEELCDFLIGAMRGGIEDDLALLAVRVLPE